MTARQGHFQLESGHHAQLWLDLDTLFVEPTRVRPLVNALAQALRANDPAVVCGPLVGGAFLAQLLASALQVEFSYTVRGPSARREGLYRAEYCLPIGALLVLGSAASSFFAQQRVPVISVAQLPYELWLPAECPLCASGLPLEDVTAPALS